MLPRIRRVVGERIPDQVKLFARAAQDADESRALGTPRRGSRALARGVRRRLRRRVLRLRDRPLARGGEGPLSRGGREKSRAGWLRSSGPTPRRSREALGETEGPVVANYNSPRQTVVSGLRDAVGDAVSRIRGRKVPLNVSFAAHSPYVAAAGEKMRGVLDAVEFRKPEFRSTSSAIDGSVLTSAGAVKEALKNQMVAPVRWVKVVDTLARMRVEELIELGGGGVLIRMLRDFELPSLKGITFDDLRTRLSQQAQNFLPRSNGE